MKKEKKIFLASIVFVLFLIGFTNACVSCCDMQLTKSVDKTNVKPGDIVTFTLKYKNIGNADCTGGGVKIQDTLDWNLNYRGSYDTLITGDTDGQGIDYSWYEIPGYDERTNTLTWNAHVVSPGEEGKIIFEVRVLEPEECGDFEITNSFKDWSLQSDWEYSNTITLFVDNDCYLPVCGNGILDDGEECDDNNLLNNDGCSSICKLEICGDGIKQANEECDDQNTNNFDYCRNNCILPYCGDNILDIGEECDLGEDNGMDSGCSAECEIECIPYCGNGILEEGEECDDNNIVDNDGCSAECEIEFPECLYNISIRYSYGNSFGTGIAINSSDTYAWVEETTARLSQGVHKIRYYVDNHEEEDNNASITVKLDSDKLISYYQNIDKSHYKTLTLDTSNLECDSFHNITVEVESESNGICIEDNPFDNLARRTIYIDCEEEHYCGDGVVDEGEECDLGNDNGVMCTPAYGGICSYCNLKCEEIIMTDGYCGDNILQGEYEECDLGEYNGMDSGCSAECEIEEECMLEIVKSVDKTNVKVGDIVKFTLKYKNVGNGLCTGTGVKIQDTLDWNLNYRGTHTKKVTGDVDGEGIYYGWQEMPGYNELTNTLIWNANIVSPGEEGEITFEVRVLEPEECGDFEIYNSFKSWSNEKGWQNSNTITLFVDNDCYCPLCGNGILDEGEECDDNNLLNNDGCSSNCRLEYCGDGVKQSNEECEDGNNVDGDGCSAECEIEEVPYCGNGILDVALNEECDMGLLNGVVCTPPYDGSCVYCSNICKEITLTDGYCGDGILQSENEECEDGNQENGDGCSSTCEIEQEECIEDISIRYSYSNSYGTGIAIGFENGTWISQISPTIPKGNYKLRYYVDNNIPNTTNYAHLTVKVDNEILSEYDYLISKYHSKTLTLDTSQLECDALHKISVNVESQHEIYCEEDDDSDNSAERYFYLSCGTICGNGILEEGEECEDGNNVDGDGCSAECEIEEEAPRCGDGIINQENETCDDNNLINNDGCSSTCKIERCGDNIKQTGEECDLGILNGVLCNPLYEGSCTYCSGTCERITLFGGYCGDGIKQSSEECDDQNTNNLDYCRNNCILPYCGDGIKDKNEYCDDGNQINGDGCSKTCRMECPDGVCTPNITIEEFIPLVWECDSRIVYEDGTRPGRITTDGEELIERINNYAFEGEQIKWKVLVMDKNGIDKVKDVYVTVDGEIEANCRRIGGTQIDPTCNARILEEEITTFNKDTMSYYECILTIETPESMYGPADITVEAEDLFGNFGDMDESEHWFLNPSVSLEIQGGLNFNSLRPGTTEYSGNVILTNGAESDSGVLLDMFISGTDFYDSSSSGAKCPTTNQLSLNRVGYYATNGAYSTLNDMEVGRTCDEEGYCKINYGRGFHDPNKFYDKNEIIQDQKVGPYYTANLLAPGADMSIVFRVEVPEPCVGNFDSGRVYFWGEAI